MQETRDTQSIILPTADWEKVENEIDDVINVAVATKNPDYALTYGYKMIKDVRLKGVAMAKLLYEISENWSKFDTEEDVGDAVDKAGICPRTTFYKYAMMYKYVLVGHPELAVKPIEGLIMITAAARE